MRGIEFQMVTMFKHRGVATCHHLFSSFEFILVTRADKNIPRLNYFSKKNNALQCRNYLKGRHLGSRTRFPETLTSGERSKSSPAQGSKSKVFWLCEGTQRRKIKEPLETSRNIKEPKQKNWFDARLEPTYFSCWSDIVFRKSEFTCTLAKNIRLTPNKFWI